MSAIQLQARVESFPIAGRFTIARGSKNLAETIRVTLHQNGQTGQGECVPYPRYGESISDTLGTIMALEIRLADGLTRAQLQDILPPGAARNALDCAYWDLAAKLSNSSVAQLAGLAPPQSFITAYTISLDTPEAMAAAAGKAAQWPLLKLKLGGDGDAARLHAIRNAVPQARLIVDANEAWTLDNLAENLAVCTDIGVELIEQPLPAGADQALIDLNPSVPICADESAHNAHDLKKLGARYQAINIKLDKTGGLTGALDLARQAQAQGLKIMLGCMVCTSLSIAPIAQLAALADWCDLYGPFLLRKDRAHGFNCQNGIVPLDPSPLWGWPVLA